MDAPTPISIETKENIIYEKKDDIIEKKEYELEINNIKYNLSIKTDNKYIYFKLSPINDIIFIYYMNKYDLDIINNKLCLVYNNLEKVVKLIDACYSNNKLLLKYDRDNEINLIIKYMRGYDEDECSLRLIKKESDINEKFEIILNEIVLMKKGKNNEIKENFEKIRNLIINIKDNINRKLEENVNIINELKKKIEKNRRIIIR